MSGDGRIGEQIGRYRLDSVIGRGGFATVYRAQDTVLDRPVALKMLDATALRDPTNSRRFLREGRTAANLDHPAVVPVYDAGDHDGIPWMAMRLVEGGALDHHLAGGRRFKPEETLALVRRIASALDHAHGNGLVHRDVKPSNIILEDGRAETAWLTDFGIAVTARSMGLYTTGALGTAAYMAPEQARPNQAGPAADLYSLSCVTYELLTGDRPFPGEDYVALLMAHANDPVPPTGVPAVDELMARALAKAIEDRPVSGSALAQELGKARDRASSTDLSAAAGTAAAGAAEAPPGEGQPAPVGPPVPVAASQNKPELGASRAPEAPGEAKTVVDESDRTLVQPRAAPLPVEAVPVEAAPQGQPVGAPQQLAGAAAPAAQNWSPQNGVSSPGYSYQPGPTGYPYQAGYSSGAAPVAPPRRRRRFGAGWLSVVIGVVLLAATGGAYYWLTLPEETQGIGDRGGAYYAYPASWSHDDSGSGMRISDGNRTMIEITHRDAGDPTDAEEELGEEEDCDGTAEELPDEDLAVGADTMARCENPDGSVVVAALAEDRLWTFSFDADISDSRRDRFLDSLEFVDAPPGTEGDS